MFSVSFNRSTICQTMNEPLVFYEREACTVKKKPQFPKSFVSYSKLTPV